MEWHNWRFGQRFGRHVIRAVERFEVSYPFFCSFFIFQLKCLFNFNSKCFLSLVALSVCRSRAEVIDFSVPYFHSGVSLLASPKTKSEIPLLAFLLPFSPELWIAIFTSLNITAVAVAVYEWLSPFGLNPWGRQRSKNFSLSSGKWICSNKKETATWNVCSKNEWMRRKFGCNIGVNSSSQRQQQC